MGAPSYMISELELINEIVSTAVKHGNNWSREKELKEVLNRYLQVKGLTDTCKVAGDKVDIHIEEK